MNPQIYLLSSTHWDREWYLPFQTMRFRLADTLDELIDTLEQQPDFQLFCLDGQTIVLEDYFEAAPENKERLQKLIAQGRIKIGPWYVMPDERLVSGESIIHNFLHGRRVARKWGVEPWKYGYLCDIFGHIGQMPQILRGFGIKGAYLGRGLGDQDWRGGFVWQGPDGSRVMGYLSTYARFTRNVTYQYGTPEYLDALKAEIDEQIKLGTSPVIILADADDHARANPHTNDILKDIQALYPKASVHHASLEEAARAMQAYEAQMPVIENELITPAADKSQLMRVVTHSLSSYYPLKLRNDRCQNFLEKMVSPLFAMSRLAGAKGRPALMELAWTYLLQNQPHDNICGCSTDQVHIDMSYRYDQCEVIGQELLDRACNALSPAASDGLALEIVNPLLYDWQMPVRREIALPQNLPCFTEPAGYSPRPSFRLYDAAGQEIPYQLHGLRRGVSHLTHGQNQEIVDMADLSLLAPVNALSVNALEIRPDPRPVRFAPLACGAAWCDNGLVRLDIVMDGTLSITDHRTGRCYAGLNRFADDGEDGNGWFHDEPIGNALRLAGAPRSIRRVSAGAACVAFAIHQEIEMPQGEMLSILTTATLWAGKPYVNVEVQLTNTAADHRLQVLMPTGCQVGAYTAGQSYHMTRRKAGRDLATLSWDEPDPLEKDMSGILYARDEQGGLAFISPAGLHEGGMDEQGVMAITLLRSFSRVLMVDQPQVCKLLGTHRYVYALAPLTEDDEDQTLLAIQEQLSITPPCRVVQGKAHAGESLLRLAQNRLMVSTVKMPEDEQENAVIVRLWNPRGAETTEQLQVGFALESASLCSLDENHQQPLPIQNHQVTLTAKPWEILTLRLTKQD